MAIKVQCVNCKQYSNDVCGLTNQIPFYNQTPCQQWQKTGIILEKTYRTSYQVISNDAEPEQPDTQKQRMFSHPFSFEGRIRRTEYWLSCIIFYVSPVFFIGILDGVGELGTCLWVLFLILDYWFLLAQGAKRCHDRGNEGWYLIIPFYWLWMLFGDGDAYETGYGPDPKGRDIYN